MSDQANEAVVRRGYKAFSEGDPAALSEVLSADVVWSVPGEHPLAGTYKGREATFAMFGQVAELSAGTYRVEPETFESDGDQVVVRDHATGERAGKKLDARSTLRFTMSGGQVVEVDSAPDDQSIWNVFWS